MHTTDSLKASKEEYHFIEEDQQIVSVEEDGSSAILKQLAEIYDRMKRSIDSDKRPALEPRYYFQPHTTAPEHYIISNVDDSYLKATVGDFGSVLQVEWAIKELDLDACNCNFFGEFMESICRGRLGDSFGKVQLHLS